MEIEPLAFLIVCLASFRITRFLVRDSLIGFAPESGSRFSVRLDRFAYNDEGTGRSWWREYVGDLLTCPHCFSFWVSYSACCLWWRLWWWDITWEQGLVVWATAATTSILFAWGDKPSATINNIGR